MAIIWSQQCSPGESCAVRDTVRFSTWPSCPHCTPCFSRGSSGAAGWEGGAGGAQGWKHRNCWEPGCRTADHTGQGEAGLAGGAAVRRKHFTGLGCVQNIFLELGAILPLLAVSPVTSSLQKRHKNAKISGERHLPSQHCKPGRARLLPLI